MTEPHILITTDLSPGATAAFSHAADLAGCMKARVTLLHVLLDVPVIPHGAPMAPPLTDPALPQRMAEAERAIEQQCALLPKDLDVTTRVVAAPKVADAILDAARETGASLVVIASRGWSGVRGLLLGSTAQAVLRTATLPVLMVPAGPGRGQPLS